MNDSQHYPTSIIRFARGSGSGRFMFFPGIAVSGGLASVGAGPSKCDLPCKFDDGGAVLLY